MFLDHDFIYLLPLIFIKDFKMTLSIFILIMIAAIIHAGWNSLIKGSDDKFMSTATLSLMTAGIMLLLLPFVTFPNHAALPYFIMSVLLQIIYYILLAQTYKITDIGLSYPIMRGTAPLLVALLSRLIWGEIIPPLSWLGILLIVGGILWLGYSSFKTATITGIFISLANASVIAIYTINDALGVRASEDAISYSIWLFFISTSMIALWAFKYRHQRFIPYISKHWKSGVIAAVGSSLSYGIILWTMQHAPIYLVSALRETSIFFVIMIAIFILKEPTNGIRITSAFLIVSGAIILRLSISINPL